MRRGVWVALALLVCLIVVDAQDSRAQSRTIPPRFEEASVKPAGLCSMQNSIDPGRIALNGDPLKLILMEAFQVKMDRIFGPSWLDADCFVVIAKMPEGATKDQLPAMFEALLVERFRLAAHRETRLQPGYALTVEKKGPKFKESEPNTNAADRRAGQVRFGSLMESAGITMSALARFLSNRLAVPVQDLAGLKGTYDIDVSWTPDRTVETIGPFAEATAAHSSSSADAGTPLPAPTGDIFTSVRESLGLRLEPLRQQVEVVVIDRVERIPAEN